MAITKESERGVRLSAAKADRALEDAAQNFLRKNGINFDLRKVEKSIRDNPGYSAAIAASAGFVVGGGMATPPGLAILFLFGRTAARAIAMDFIASIVRTPAR